MLASCGFLPLTSNQQADAEMQLIQGAVKHHDAAALEELFSNAARAKAPSLDDEISNFLDFFPSGFKNLGEPAGGPGEFDEYKFGDRTVELYGNYKVEANGKAYNLYFADFTVNQIDDPNNVGLYALGVAPYNAHPTTHPTSASDAFFAWASQYGITDHKATGTPSVYVYAPSK
jgi:hypothetical protein